MPLLQQLLPTAAGATAPTGRHSCLLPTVLCQPPLLSATCLELLRGHLKPGARVLDVGSGALAAAALRQQHRLFIAVLLQPSGQRWRSCR